MGVDSRARSYVSNSINDGRTSVFNAISEFLRAREITIPPRIPVHVFGGQEGAEEERIYTEREKNKLMLLNMY